MAQVVHVVVAERVDVETLAQDDPHGSVSVFEDRDEALDYLMNGVDKDLEATIFSAPVVPKAVTSE